MPSFTTTAIIAGAIVTNIFENGQLTGLSIMKQIDVDKPTSEVYAELAKQTRTKPGFRS